MNDLASNREAIFLSLVAEHRTILYKVARAYGRTQEDRADLVGEMTVALWTSFGRFDERYRFSTWMYRIALNVAISYYRVERRRLAHAARPVRRASLEIAETKLRGLARMLVLEIVSNALVLLFVGGFAAEHVREWPVVAAAVTLDVYFAAILATGIAQYVALRQIDDDAALLATTERVQRLCFVRAQAQMWTLILAPLLWLPMLIVALRAFFGIDALATFRPAWLAANVVFGAGVLLLGITWAKRNGSQPPAGVLRRIADSLAGTNVRAAADELDRLRRYDAETGP